MRDLGQAGRPFYGLEAQPAPWIFFRLTTFRGLIPHANRF
jgi:hypothetical protein